jgi:hypothetical protein
LPAPDTFTQISNVSSLNIHRRTTILLPGAEPEDGIRYDKHFFKFLQHCVHLTHLTITLHDNDDPWTTGILGPQQISKLDAFLRQVAEEVPSLETLRVALGHLDDSWFLDYILPVGSLKRFTKLKHLLIAQKLLLGADEPTIIGDTRLLSHILSPCLETFEIDFPSEAVFAFFDRLLQQRATFADIKDVVVHCATNERG